MKYISLIFILLIVACKAPGPKMKKDSGTRVPLSAYAMLFINELENKVSLPDLSCSYIPDTVFMKKYGLGVNDKGECLVDGIITFKDGFVWTETDASGLNVSHLYKNKYRFRFSLCRLSKLLNNSNIIYLDISKPVFKF